MSVQAVPDVLVVGGGVIGLSIAYSLAKSGATVTVLEQGQPGREASWAGAGMLPPGCVQGARTPSALLRAFSHQLWRDFSRELFELTGLDNGYRESGGMELGFAGDELRIDQEVAAWQAEGVRVERLSPAALHARERAISPHVTDGYYLPDFAQVRNPRHLKALVKACELRGVRIVSDAEVTQFEVTSQNGAGGRIATAQTNQKRFPAGQFVIAGGAWAGGITRMLGVNLPVRPIRGQMVLLSAWPLPFLHILNHGPRYLVPREDGHILVGATEEEVGFEKRNTVEGVTGLLQFAQQIVPGLATAKMEQTWSGLRPGSPTGDPFLSRLPNHANGYVAAGHFRAGLQLSPATGALMSQLILTGTTEIDLRAFEVHEGKFV